MQQGDIPNGIFTFALYILGIVYEFKKSSHYRPWRSNTFG
jgi:hypothetical protein